MFKLNSLTHNMAAMPR